MKGCRRRLKAVGFSVPLAILFMLIAIGSVCDAADPVTPPAARQAGKMEGPAAPQVPSSGAAGADAEIDTNYDEEDKSATAKEAPKEPAPQISDPIEPFNRAMYHFNDKFYFWVMKPVATGYKAVVPGVVRTGVNNFFENLAFPIRFVNCLLQADIKCAGIETGRFIVNTLAGVGGLLDPASDREVGLPKQERDFGQTLGVYGIGPGIFITWPILGPSNPRDTIGFAGDLLLYPVTYLSPWYASLSIQAGDRVNEASLSLGDYEALKEASIDHYVAIRDAYIQYRAGKVKRAKASGQAAAAEEKGGNRETEAPKKAE